MDFNFSGMMRGLGAGMVQTGAWMKEQEKLNWETQQATLKYEREQHMERLRMQNQALLQKQGLEHTEKMTSMQMEQAQANANRSYELDKEKLAIDKQQAAATAANQQRSAALEERRLKILETQANEPSDTMKMYNDKKEIIQEQAKALYPDNPKMQGMFMYSAMFGTTAEGKPLPEAAIKAGAEAVSNFQTSNPEEYEKGFEQYKKEHKDASQIEYDSLLATEFASRIGGQQKPSGVMQQQSSTSSAPKEKVNLQALVDNKDYDTIQALLKQYPNDINLIEANRIVVSSMQNKPKEVTKVAETPVTDSDKVSQTKSDIKSGALMTKLNKLAKANHGKPFSMLTEAQKVQIQNMVE